MLTMSSSIDWAKYKRKHPRKRKADQRSAQIDSKVAGEARTAWRSWRRRNRHKTVWLDKLNAKESKKKLGGHSCRSGAIRVWRPDPEKPEGSY